MVLLRRLALIGSTLLLSVSAFAAKPANVAEIEARFAGLGMAVTEVKNSDIEGLYEVHTSQGMFFTTASGDYFLHGKLYSLDKKGQFTDVIAKRYADKIPEYASSWIEYKAKNEKYAITVFTDVDCGYCLKLHRQMQGYNDLGITVRYMAFPRAGVQSQVGLTMAQIWCSDDRKAAMDEVKLQRSLSKKPEKVQQCLKTIAEHHDLGRKIGVTGTPAIVTAEGRVIGGFMEPKDLLAQLDAMAAQN